MAASRLDCNCKFGLVSFYGTSCFTITFFCFVISVTLDDDEDKDLSSLSSHDTGGRCNMLI